MAQRTVVSLVDDLDGTEADETVELGIDGVTYEIDLTNENAEALREVFAPYIAAARRMGRTSRRSAPTPTTKAAPKHSRETNQAVRQWANRNGWTVSDRGRIPSEVYEAWEKGLTRTPQETSQPSPASETPDESGRDNGTDAEGKPWRSRRRKAADERSQAGSSRPDGWGSPSP